MALEIEPITPTIGAYIHIAAEDATKSNAPGEILKALDHYNVLVFPQIHMSDDIFIELTAALGERHDNTVTDDGSGPAKREYSESHLIRTTGRNVSLFLVMTTGTWTVCPIRCR